MRNYLFLCNEKSLSLQKTNGYERLPHQPQVHAHLCRGAIRSDHACNNVLNRTVMNEFIYRFFQVLLWIAGIAIVAAVAVVSFRLGQMLSW